MTTNKDYEVKITIAGKFVVIPKGVLSSVLIQSPIIEIMMDVDSAFLGYEKGNEQIITLDFKKEDKELFDNIRNLKTEHTQIEFLGDEVCVIDTQKKDELKIKIL